MAGKKRWTTRAPTGDGIWTIELSSWKHFHDFIHQKMLHYTHYIWRGQSDSSWKLETSLDRALKGKRYDQRPLLVSEHLERFKYASRGRRDPKAVRIQDENDWWALGQHTGLCTPLLDWTESPFVALYFAFEKKDKPTSGFRSVWALANMSEKNEELRRTYAEGHDKSAKTRELEWVTTMGGAGAWGARAKGDGPPVLQYVRPLQDDNARLVSQSGLFTRVPFGMTVDNWIQEHCAGVDEAFLIHLRIPEKDRADCLCTLNRMNISHRTLFPDLYGSAEHCNKALAIVDYCPPSSLGI